MIKRLICFLLNHEKTYIARVHFNKMYFGLESFDSAPPNWDSRATHFTYRCERCGIIDNEMD